MYCVCFCSTTVVLHWIVFHLILPTRGLYIQTRPKLSEWGGILSGHTHTHTFTSLVKTNMNVLTKAETKQWTKPHPICHERDSPDPTWREREGKNSTTKRGENRLRKRCVMTNLSSFYFPSVISEAFSFLNLPVFFSPIEIWI